ncbi:hypothetical protein ACCAA_650003 [Candidatus Accumulibacter aalborgensis]|uniref:Uncharacterized protein n=1 Tax=Candidatus Accumulibacter aalborgensis TaxID=1860102 RepID=A0A1A8XVX3_9PROT|nr:hypothetical protein ACCAA_650003 [Candidatus Accumulibacter aalborgensis]
MSPHYAASISICRPQESPATVEPGQVERLKNPQALVPWRRPSWLLAAMSGAREGMFGKLLAGSAAGTDGGGLWQGQAGNEH